VVKLFLESPKKGKLSGVLAQGKFDASDFAGAMTGASINDLLEEIRAGNAARVFRL